MTYIEVDLQYLQDNSNLCRLTEVLSLNLKKNFPFVIKKFVIFTRKIFFDDSRVEGMRMVWYCFASRWPIF